MKKEQQQQFSCWFFHILLDHRCTEEPVVKPTWLSLPIIYITVHKEDSAF